MSLRLKFGLIALLPLLAACALFVAYALATTGQHKRLRIDGVVHAVESACQKVNKTLTRMEQNAIDLAGAGHRYHLTDPRRDDMAEATVVDNFEGLPAAIGGGIWFEPDAIVPGLRLHSFYAHRDPERDRVRRDERYDGDDYDYPTQAWYQDIARAVTGPRQTAWTAPYFDDTGTLTLMTTVGAGMFNDNGRFLGMATVDWEISRVVRELTSIRPTPGTFALLASPRHNRIISDSRHPDAVPDTPLDSLVWRAGLPPPGPDGTLPQAVPVSIDGRVHRVFQSRTDNGWRLSVHVPDDEIFADIETRNAVYTALVALIALALLLMTMRLVARFIHAPLQRLMDGVADLGRGNLNVHMDLGTRDELQSVAHAFNRMTVDLQASLAHEAHERAERQRIAGELDVATRIQASMLPTTYPPFPDREEFEIFAAMRPAREVGGDFYDFFFVDPDHLAVAVADVSGKGIPAALFMVVARTLLKNNAQNGLDPAQTLATVNNLLCEGNDANMFVTAFLGVLDVRSGHFIYANAGHNPPLLQRADHAFESLAIQPGFVLAGMPGLSFPQGEIDLRPGDTLLLYTDGVTEAANAAHDLFGPHRLLDTLNRAPYPDVRALIADIEGAVTRFVDGAEVADDLTLLALRSKTAGLDWTERSFDADLERWPDAADFLEETLSSMGCPAKSILRIQVAAEEVFVNIAHYAYAPGTGEMRLRIAVFPEKTAHIEFEDTGRAFNPLDKPDPEVMADIDDRVPGGLGIYMVKQMMDSVDYRRVGPSNRLRFTLAWT